MKKTIEQFQLLCKQDVSQMPKADRLKFYEDTIAEINTLLDNRKITSENFDILFQLKRDLLAKVYMLKN